MVVSIGKIHVKSLKVNLPTDVPAAQKEAKEDFITLSVSADGVVQLDKDVVPTKDALLARLQDLYAKNKEQKFLITADREARHGETHEGPRLGPPNLMDASTAHADNVEGGQIVGRLEAGGDDEHVVAGQPCHEHDVI